MELVPAPFELTLIRMTRAFPELLDGTNNLEVKLHFDNDLQEWQFSIGGFYKHGSVTITPVGDGLDGYEVNGRYGSLDRIWKFEDLVAVNWYQYQSFKDRGYSLDDAWKAIHLTHGRIKVVQVEQIVEC